MSQTVLHTPLSTNGALSWLSGAVPAEQAPHLRFRHAHIVPHGASEVTGWSILKRGTKRVVAFLQKALMVVKEWGKERTVG